MQCPLCYYYFPRSEIGGHASECTGKGIDPEDDDDGPRIGTKRVIRKNTIGDAVRLDENERKRYAGQKIVQYLNCTIFEFY
jgi:hypothetical protein